MDKAKENIPKDIKKIEDPDTRKEISQAVANGEIEHKQINAGINNLKKSNLAMLDKTDPERAAAIRKKGWEAMMAIKGERKTAKQSLDQFLPLFARDTASDENIPDDIKKLLNENNNIKVTQYDLIMLSMIAQARNGNVKAAEYIRDTYGDKPINETHNINETISEADKKLIEKLQIRLNIIDQEQRTFGCIIQEETAAGQDQEKRKEAKEKRYI